MKINMAKFGGFCFGVRRAIDVVENLIEKQQKPIYTLGEIIHNKLVVDDLSSRGVKIIEDLDQADAGDLVVIRAHGVAKHIYQKARKKEIKLIDATCPFVTRVHKLADEYSNKGYYIYIVGKASHPEVIGIAGWSHGRYEVLADIKQVEQLPYKQKAIVVAQTTIVRKHFEQIVKRLNHKVNTLKIFDTICATTTNRQEEAKQLAHQSDIVLVLGSRESSNTQKLYEISNKYCENTKIIEKTSDIPLEKIQSNGIISVIAGASTPNWMMMEVFTRMNELDKTKTGNSGAGRIVETHGVVDPEQSVMTAEEQDFLEAFEKTLVPIRSGQVLTGTVVQVTDSEVSVNIGYKSDGFIPRSEFTSEPGSDEQLEIKVGDEIEVEVIKVNDSEGNVLLSHKSVEARKAWDAFVDRAEVEDAIFEGIGREVVKGGLIAYIEGVRTFVPASQVSNRYVENLGDYVGKPMRLKILEVDRNKRRVVASQKSILMEEAAEKRKEVWGTLEVGEKRKGVVRRLTDFGAFVDIGGIDGLVHVTEMAWGRVKHPRDIFAEDQEIEVVVKSLDSERERISLGYKELQPDPWEEAAEQFPVGSVVEGKVVRIKPFGAFVSLAPRIDGLIHISQVATRRIDKVEDELKIGQSVRVKILSVDIEAKRISLSTREVLLDEQAEENSLEDMVAAPESDVVKDEIEISAEASEPEEHEEHVTSSLEDVFVEVNDDEPNEEEAE